MSRQTEVQATRRAVLCAACAAPLIAACGAADPDPTALETVAPSGSAGAVPTATPSGSAEPGPTTTRPAAAAPSASADPTSGGAGTPAPAPAGTPSTATSKPKPAPQPSTVAPPAGALVKVSEVPVGGGVVLGGDGIVVTQPSAGTFRGFSTTCTHSGCSVNRVTGGNIVCPCHGSSFSVVDGSVTRKPALKPLASRGVTVRSGWVCKA
jgi:Rieske Fe-S protein